MRLSQIHIAIVGAGRVAQHYKEILDSGVVSDFKVVGICDLNETARLKLSKHWKCPSFDNLKDMINTTLPHLVLILTPSGLHFEHTKIALDLGCNVLVEKPVTMIPSQAKELDSLAKEKNLMLCVAFQNRLNPAISCLKSALDQNRFGKITTSTVRLRWCRYQEYYEDEWHGTWAQDGGVINQQAIHHIDALNWLIGPIEEVCAIHTNRLNKLEAEDTLVAILHFKNGALGTIEATTAARPCDIEASLSVIGEKGTGVIGGIALNKVETWNFVEEKPDDKHAADLYSVEVPTGYGLSHGPLLQKIIDRLKLKSSIAPIPVEQCISTTELIHAMYASHETSGWISLKDNHLSNYLGK